MADRPRTLREALRVVAREWLANEKGESRYGTAEARRRVRARLQVLLVDG